MMCAKVSDIAVDSKWFLKFEPFFFYYQPVFFAHVVFKRLVLDVTTSKRTCISVAFLLNCVTVDFSLGVILDNEMRMTKCNFMQLTHTLTKTQQLGLRKLYKKNCRCIVSSKYTYQPCKFVRCFPTVSFKWKQNHSKDTFLIFLLMCL